MNASRWLVWAAAVAFSARGRSKETERVSEKGKISPCLETTKYGMHNVFHSTPAVPALTRLYPLIDTLRRPWCEYYTVPFSATRPMSSFWF